MLDPRFKKLEFKEDRFLTAQMRRDAEKWLTEEFNKNYRGKFKVPDAGADGNNDGQAPVAPQPKRQKVSVAGFFGDSDESEDDTAAEDELAEYLALPQDKKVKATEWWSIARTLIQTIFKRAKTPLFDLACGPPRYHMHPRGGIRHVHATFKFREHKTSLLTIGSTHVLYASFLSILHTWKPHCCTH